ncbi:MAG: von Willebrand factor type A domain-containing protein [Thermoanaerobaculia bacterium]|nr:von Willebrand factor type A domain-containing protein [Thermoanaerobaculia bacterium]
MTHRQPDPNDSTRPTDRRKSPHEDPATGQIEPKDLKESAAMYEADHPTNEERELERLFADDLGLERLPAPPEGLADRIKAEIPADLGWRTEAAADENMDAGKTPGVVVPLYRHRGFLALAATLVLAVGLWTLVPRHQEGTGESRTPSSPAPPAAESPDTESSVPRTEGVHARSSEEPPESGLLRSAPTSSEIEGPAEPGLASGEKPQRQIRHRQEAGRTQLLEQLGPAAPVTEDSDSRVETDTAARNRRVPAPEPAPDESSQLLETEPEEMPVVEEEIVVTSESPINASSKLSVSSSVATAEPEPAPGPAAPASPAPEPPPSVAERYQELEKKVVVDRHEPTSPSLLKPSSSLQPPNDEAYDAMFFDSAGVNPFVDTEDDALSTFGFDVDTASYTVVRRYLQDGNLPPQEAVRVEEMLNFFDYGDAPPSDDELEEGDFALHVDIAPSRWAPGDNRSERYYLVRFGVKARDVLATERPPALLTFVVDVSGSMAREDRLGLVKRSLGLLLENLQEDDQVALVVYGSQGRVLLPPTSDHVAVRAAIELLQPEGSTNAAEGLRLAYELTARNHRSGRIHRVILCSDGVANVGTTTSGEGILGEIKQWADQGIELTTVGFGMGNYNDELMETLADQGNGRYSYVDTLDEARRIFVDDLTGTLTTVAAEARAQVEFDPDVISRYRLLGYENRDISDERFRDDTVDAGEIGAGHSVTALYEVKTERPLSRRDRLGTLTVRYASVARGEIVEQELSVSGRDASRSFSESPRALRLAATVAEFAEVLRGSYWARDVDLSEVFAEARKVSADWPAGEPSDAAIAEFASLVGKAEQLRDRQ